MQVCSASIIMATPRVASESSIAATICGRQRFLGLQASGEDVNDAGELREANDAIARIVADMSLAEERRHMMLAVRNERNVSYQHEIVVARNVMNTRDSVSLALAR